MPGTTPTTSTSLPEHSSSAGASLSELSRDQLLLVVFLRHAGCTFCRQAMSDLHKIGDQLEAEGARVVIVGMSPETEMVETAGKYHLDNAVVISDPERKLYQHFEFGSGGLSELMSPTVFWKGMKACIFEGHGAGKKEGDIRQMPGIIIMQNDNVLLKYAHKTAADRPDYLQLVKEAKRQSPAADVQV